MKLIKIINQLISNIKNIIIPPKTALFIPYSIIISPLKNFLISSSVDE
jgi:hypothetical protein